MNNDPWIFYFVISFSCVFSENYFQPLKVLTIYLYARRSSVVLFLWDCVLCVWLRGGCARSLGHTCVSSPCSFLTLLGLVLPLAGTLYVAARGWGLEHRASPAHGTPSAIYGSLPLRELERSEQSHRIRWTRYLSHLSLSGTPGRGKSRHFNQLRHSWKVILMSMKLENNSFLAGV